MKLDYRILWFEDNRSSFDVKQLSVKRIVEKLGFNFPMPRNEINSDNLDNINFQIYDLIIADLKLSAGVKGSTILNNIRDKGIYTEVIFYSSAGENYVRTELSKYKIDGVYCANRKNDDFIEKVEKVIETTIKKVQDVNNTRGLVIAETIILEKKIEEILLKYFNSAITPLDKKKSVLLKKIYDRIVQKHSSDIKEINRLNFKKIKDLIDNDIITASNSFDAIHSILKDKIKNINTFLHKKGITVDEKIENEAKRNKVSTIKSDFNSFREEILKIRNTLAHVEEEIGEDGIPILKSINTDGTVIKFDNEKYIRIRKDLLKHSNNLDKINAQINLIF